MNEPGFVDHCVELLSLAGAPRPRRMFGGHGLYIDELFVALVIGDTLYLKTDEASRERFRAAGGEPFVYEGKDGKPVSVGYWTPPEEAMESPREMLPWARLAMASAVAARKPPRAAAKKAPATKTPATKTPAKKAPAKKAPAKKAATKKTAARKRVAGTST